MSSEDPNSSAVGWGVGAAVGGVMALAGLAVVGFGIVARRHRARRRMQWEVLDIDPKFESRLQAAYSAGSEGEVEKL